MYEAVLILLVGLVLLLFTTYKLVKLAENVSAILKISPLIVGITVVAIGTSLPELVVSGIAAAKQDVGLAVGNIVGSNIVNILMVFPVGLFIGKLRVGSLKTQQNALALIPVTILFVATQLIQLPAILSGVLLLSVTILVTRFEYKLGVFGRKNEDAQLFQTRKKQSITFRTVMFGLILLLGIVVGGLFVVNSIESIAVLTGISTTILGLTLTSVATSLPELLTTIFSQHGRQEKLTVGNVIGSNIYNLSLIGGVIAFSPNKAQLPLIDWIWLVLSTLGFVLLLRIYKGKQPPRVIGGLLLLLLFLYLFMQTGKY